MTGIKDFLGKPAPAGYVAGIGRGASGFVTRPDLGPGASIAATAPREEDGDDSLLRDDVENEEGLLAVSGPQAADDEEADNIYAMIETKLSERRKPKADSKKPIISGRSVGNDTDPMTLFAKERLQLKQVTSDEWAQLPESGNFLAKRTKKSNDRERYTPVPDSVLLGSNFGGDFNTVGEAREKVLGARLDMTAPDAGRSTSIDPVGYLTSLDAQGSSGNITNPNDIKRARILLKNAIQANPNNPSAWISAARIEEVARNIKHARNIINEAIEKCGDSDEIWLEAIRLVLPADAIGISKKAIQRVQKSAKLWIKAAELEKDVMESKRILRKGLEEIPDSVLLWKSLVEREDDAEDARILLAKAVECCPTSVELWIALARLETHENARRVLNKARQTNPLSTAMWIAAARLEEAHGNVNGMVEKIIARAVHELTQRGLLKSREEWLKEAVACEETGDVICAQALVKNTALNGLDEVDVLPVLLDDASSHQTLHPVITKTFIEIAIEKCNHDETAWLKLLKLSAGDGVPGATSHSGEAHRVCPHPAKIATLDHFERAVSACPKSTEIWKLYASTQGSSQIYERAIRENPQDVDLWCEFVDFKIMQEQSPHGAEQILGLASGRVRSERIWKKRVKIALLLEKHKDAYQLAIDGIKEFPASEQLWLLLASFEGEQLNWAEALRSCPNSPTLYIRAAQSLAKTSPMQARSMLERARKTFATDELVWLASVQLENQLEATFQAKVLLSRALQILPTSPILWFEAIRLEARPAKKAKAMEALKRCGQNALIFLSIASIMESERNIMSAKDYYERAISADPSIGDVWAAYLLFIKRQDPESEASIWGRLEKAKPKEGHYWRLFRKQSNWMKSDFKHVFAQFLQSNLLDQ